MSAVSPISDFRSSTGGRRIERPRRRIWVPVVWTLIVLLVLLVVAAAIIAAILVPKALGAKDALESAVPLALQTKDSIIAGDSEAARTSADELAVLASEARQQTDDELWKSMEWVPVVGPNLHAARVISAVVDDLASDVVVPASTLSLESLAPVDGVIQLDALAETATVLTNADTTLERVTSALSTIERDAVVEQIGSGVTQLDDVVREARDTIAPLATVVHALPAVLGADGPRNYLMMFQGNSEVRATGGNPAAFILLEANGGALNIVRQASSSDFRNGAREPVIQLDAETETIYSNIIGTYVPNMTATPDFPTTVSIAQAWWAEEFDDRIDGVVSFDPVGLGYLLSATGPLTLETGDQLTAENAAKMLLHDAYFMYPDGLESNAFFASAAKTVFDQLTRSVEDPVALLAAIARSADEGRLKLWSANADEQALIAHSDLAGQLPVSNQEVTSLGVFFNDTTGAKMDYFVDANIAVASDVCQTDASPQFTTTVSFTNSSTAELAATLPLYITGPYYTPGDIATDFVIYSPVGATIESWTVNGTEYPARARGTHLGRDVVRLDIVTGPQATTTVEVKMRGSGDPHEYGPLEVRHTPMVRDTGVTIEAPGCAPVA